MTTPVLPLPCASRPFGCRRPRKSTHPRGSARSCCRAASPHSSAPSAPATPAAEEGAPAQPLPRLPNAGRGYLAGNTLAASRLNTAIKETPVSIDVFTPELLKDLGATSLEDAMAYANNLQMDEGDTDRLINGDSTVLPRAAYQFRSRGFLGTRARNFFETELSLELTSPADSTIARPNSILSASARPAASQHHTKGTPALSELARDRAAHRQLDCFAPR